MTASTSPLSSSPGPGLATPRPPAPPPQNSPICPRPSQQTCLRWPTCSACAASTPTRRHQPAATCLSRLTAATSPDGAAPADVRLSLPAAALATLGLLLGQAAAGARETKGMPIRHHSVDSVDGGPLIYKSALNLLGPSAWLLQLLGMEWRAENAAHEHPRTDAKVVLFLFTDRSHARRPFSGPQLPQAARRQAGDPGPGPCQPGGAACPASRVA